MSGKPAAKAAKAGGNNNPTASAELVVAEVPYVSFLRRPIVNGAYVNDGTTKVLYLPFMYMYICICIYIYEFTYITSINVARV